MILDQFKLDGDAQRDALRSELAVRKWYAKGTRAENEYNAGRYDKVREMLEPVVAKLKAEFLHAYYRRHPHHREYHRHWSCHSVRW